MKDASRAVCWVVTGCLLVFSAHAGRTTNAYFDFTYDDGLTTENVFADVNHDLIMYSSTVGVFRPFTTIPWTTGSYRMFHTPNAGGTSDLSEAVSYDMMWYILGATLYQTEEEVPYKRASQKTDYVMQVSVPGFGGATVLKKASVSVTRAVGYNRNTGFTTATQQACKSLLEKKLLGVIEADVNSVDDWDLNVLHVFAWDDATKDNIIAALNQIRSTVGIRQHRETVIIVTVPAATVAQPVSQPQLVFNNAANNRNLYTTTAIPGR